MWTGRPVSICHYENKGWECAVHGEPDPLGCGSSKPKVGKRPHAFRRMPVPLAKKGKSSFEAKIRNCNCGAVWLSMFKASMSMYMNLLSRLVTEG